MSIPACYGIIPARYQSTRFPGKPLAMILGKPMFAHVYERASRCPELSGVALATDDERIEKAAKELDIPVVMTRPDHSSGTDRVLEAALAMDLDDDAVVVNIQGDEPALEPRMLSELLGPFDDPTVSVATLAARIGPDEAASPDRVKVALAKSGRALYFSRAPIPYAPAGELASYLLHIGLYAFRMETLKRFAELPPTPLEEREKLEQLRLLENGIDIRVVETRHCCHGVDRPEDLDKITHILMEQGT